MYEKSLCYLVSDQGKIRLTVENVFKINVVFILLQDLMFVLLFCSLLWALLELYALMILTEADPAADPMINSKSLMQILR